MNFFILIGVIGASLIGTPFLITSQAQVEMEGFTPEDRTKYFNLLQFDIYIRASNIGDGDRFLNDIEIERAKHVLKELPVKTKKELFCNHTTHGEIYRIYGSYIFKESTSAQTVKQWLKNNLPIDKIDYAEFYHTNNNHHWGQPTPDEIIEHRVYGNETQFDQVVIECSRP